MALMLGGKGLEEMNLRKYCKATGRTREEILAWLPVMAGSMYGFFPEKARQVLRPLF